MDDRHRAAVGKFRQLEFASELANEAARGLSQRQRDSHQAFVESERRVQDAQREAERTSFVLDRQRGRVTGGRVSPQLLAQHEALKTEYERFRRACESATARAQARGQLVARCRDYLRSLGISDAEVELVPEPVVAADVETEAGERPAEEVA